MMQYTSKKFEQQDDIRAEKVADIVKAIIELKEGEEDETIAELVSQLLYAAHYFYNSAREENGFGQLSVHATIDLMSMLVRDEQVERVIAHYEEQAELLRGEIDTLETGATE